MLPLGLLGTGERAEVIEIVSGRHLNTRIEDIGVRIGRIIEMLSNEGKGPILVKADESRIAIGRVMAMKIMVKRL
ncbi:MAG: ferrous iron transport protein A [Nitrospirae bacterium]|nr:ferrous iron transport protein A [Nitrospirota bacterium]MDA8214508.1 FeoA family protein [Nitrospiraceae bacterium]MDA8339921.1 FeoA family protein [Nitrospiraceae bacterium]